jgi:GDP-4-dehydro-6-deoxy-D-mannose reductase
MKTQAKAQQKILITGGTGFAGSHLVEALLTAQKATRSSKAEHEIHVTAYGDNSGYVKQLLPAKQIHPLDLTNKKATHKLIAQLKPDQIYHLAAIAGVGSSFSQVKKVIMVNFEIELNLLAAAQQYQPQARVLIIGSALQYKPSKQPLSELAEIGPVSPYGVSKVLQDSLAYSLHRQQNLQIIRARPFNHIGERQTPGFVVADFAQQIARFEAKQTKNGSEPPIMKVGNLSAVRDFTDVKDMVQAYILLMNQGQVGQVYNLGSGQGYSIQHILDTLLDLARIEIEVEPDPDKQRPVEVPYLVCDNSKICQLGWEPTIELRQSLERILNYYRQSV